MPVPKDYPLESFDPRYEKILLRAARGENFTIQCRTSSEAHRLQHMLHSYRHRAKVYYGDANPEKWRPLYTAIVGRKTDKNGRKTILHVYSRHDEFGDLLANIVPDSDAPLFAEDPLAEFDPVPEAKPEGSGGG